MRKGFFQLSLLSLFSIGAFAQEIKTVNFVQEGEVSKLVIEVDKEVPAERFHVSEDKQIILDLKNVKVSPKLLRGIDTSEFPGSAVYVSGYKKPGSKNDVRFAVQLRDNVRSILDVSSKTITLSIENRFGVFSKNKLQSSNNDTRKTINDLQASDSVGLSIPKSNDIQDILENLTLSGPKKYIGKRISISVKEIPIRELLNMIADTSGFNIIIDNAINALPPLTLTLTNVPWDQALDTIMNLSKLVAQKSSNILIMKTLEQSNKEREEQVKADKLKQTAEPLVTRVFLINYAALPEISTVIKDYLTPQRGSTQSDERTNSLIVKDTVESIERIKKIVETLDTQTPQVLIEAKIVEANESYSRRIGLSRGLSFGYDPVGLQAPATVIDPVATQPGFAFSSGTSPELSRALGVSISIFKRLTNLSFELELMESESQGRIISTPKVVTQNKKKALISSTETTSFSITQLINGVANNSFNTVSAELALSVTPQVTNDGAISMEIDLQKSAFGDRPSAQAPPNLNKRSVKTNVLVDNGSTVVIGGLYQTTSLEAVSGIPLLKDLPLVGWLFRTPTATNRSKNELLIFMTPRIMNQEEAGLTERQASTSALGSSSEL